MADKRGRPFQPGNKFGRGRPAGSRNKATIALQQMLDSHGEAITKKCAILALQGDPTALRLSLERVLPPRKHFPVEFKLPPIKTAADVSAALGAVLRAVADGKLTVTEGHAVTGMLEMRRRVIETEELEARLRALEERHRPNATAEPPQADPAADEQPGGEPL